MASPDSSLVEDALIAKLLNDAALKAVLPDGWWWDIAGAVAAGGQRKPQRFGILSLVDHSDVAIFGGRAWEDYTILVKGVVLQSTGGNVKAAAARIDAILDPQPPEPPCSLEIEGYGTMAIFRERRIRYTEVDQNDIAIRWLHRGGHYRFQVTTGASAL